MKKNTDTEEPQKKKKTFTHGNGRFFNIAPLKVTLTLLKVKRERADFETASLAHTCLRQSHL